MRSLYFLTILGLIAFSGARAEDPVDGEVTDDAAASKISDEEDLLPIGASSDVGVSFVFTQPPDANTLRELYAGKVIKFLIGFQNKGEKDFIVKFSETSFRYPLDFNYHLQNFTQGTYNRRVAPKEEVTLDYAMMAHESFAGRPLGLVVNLHYEDGDGKYFVSNVFNETVTIVEDESGFNTETTFLFLVFIGIGIGLLVLGQGALTKLGRKTGLQSKKRPVVEQTTASSSEVDYEWIPRDLLKEKKSPKTPGSPRQRKAVRKAE